MSGLKQLQQKFVTGEARLHLNSPSGNYPLYVQKDKEGVVAVKIGTWEEIEETDKFGNVTYREPTVDEAILSATPIAPEADKGCTVEPIELIIRNLKSPDADDFRKHFKVDLKARQKEANRKAKNPKTYVKDVSKDKLTDERVQLISAASCVAGFSNVPSDDEDGALMKYNREAVIQFLEDYPVAVEQIGLFVLDQKKFDSVS